MMQYNTNKKTAIIVGFVLCLFFLLPQNVHAAGGALYTNSDTGYSIYIEDEADLLTDEEEMILTEKMKNLTRYCSVLFYSTNTNSYGNTNRLAQEVTYGYYGDKSEGHEEAGTSFIIDMDERNIWVYSRGGIEKRLTTSYANSITDNAYSYASEARYFDCAKNAFNDMFMVLDGQRIAQPMKYISNVLLALIGGFYISFIAVLIAVRSKKESAKTIVEQTNHKVLISHPSSVLTNTTKRYSPQSSGSGGSGGGGRSGGGGGGGHSGGGGGGHHF